MNETANTIELRIQRLPHSAGLQLPAYQTAGAAGMDLAAAVTEHEPLVLAPGQRALVPTGLAVAVPTGFEMQIRPRSGLALQHGVTVLNTPGTIDSDYRGEVQVMLINHGDAAFTIARGERIAQAVIVAIAQATVREVTTLDSTERGVGGFGSTGNG